MTASIIIVNYNTRAITADCLRHISTWADRQEYETIVVDNGSSDGSAEKIREEFSDTVRVIINSNNQSFGRANNQGAKVSNGCYLFFLNSDTIVEENILTKLISILEENEKIGIVSPRLLTASGESQADAYGRFPTITRLIFKDRRRKNGKERGREQRKIEGKEGIIPVDWISGCAMMIRRDLFEELGGFDENFFMYFEDVDICKRAKKKGYGSAVCPATEIVHLGGKSLDRKEKRKEYYYQSQDYYFGKWFGGIIKYIMIVVRCPIRLKYKK